MNYTEYQIENAETAIMTSKRKRSKGVREKIVDILLECGISKDNVESMDYMKSGFLDSLMMAEIIIALEDHLKIEIDGDDITPENFKNINSILIVVEKSLGKR